MDSLKSHFFADRKINFYTWYGGAAEKENGEKIQIFPLLTMLTTLMLLMLTLLTKKQLSTALTLEGL